MIKENTLKEDILISAPGRICLFGEHQDYLGLPVIAAAISRHFLCKSAARKDDRMEIYLRDVDERISFSITDTQYTKGREYFKSAINVLRRKGVDISHGLQAELWSNIPIQAGVSSSSAMLNAWMLSLIEHFSSRSISSETRGEWVYEAEVEEFGEPGGRMDQYAISIGNTILLETYPSPKVSRLSPVPGSFVLVQSGQPKDTLPILKFARDKRLEIAAKIKQTLPDFSWHTAETSMSFDFLYESDLELCQATIRNRDILREALELWQSPKWDASVFAQLLTEQHHILSKALKVSTELIDHAIQKGIQAGALGGKIVGSGGGGCFILYAIDDPSDVIKAMHDLGLKADVVQVVNGTQRID